MGFRLREPRRRSHPTDEIAQRRRSGQAVGAVIDEDALAGVELEPVAGRPIHPGIRLCATKLGRDHEGLDHAIETELPVDLDHSGRRIGHDRDLHPSSLSRANP